MRLLRPIVFAAIVLALAVPGVAVGKRKPPPPPPPPPDSAADCRVVVEQSIDDYVVLATLVVGVRCDTVKQRIDATISEFTRDGVSVPLLPVGASTRTCTGTAACFAAIDLFSYDNHPVAFPGDQLYCATGFGVVGATVLGPASGCENDPRL